MSRFWGWCMYRDSRPRCSASLAGNAHRGMTLIELMIVVALLAILGAIAIPSYQGYVMKARRADARAALTTAAQMLERYATENSSKGYKDANSADVVPATSENGHYTLTLTIPNTTPAWTYTLKAEPSGSQRRDACGSFTLTQSGLRGVATISPPHSAPLSKEQCW